MKKVVLTIDIEKCENCNNCFLACKDEHFDNNWPGYATSQPLHGQRWMNILKKEHGKFPSIRVAYLPKPCFHCDTPACMDNSSDDSIYKREDGIVLIDPERAKGKRELVKRCPYGAIWWNSESETPQKCTMCAHLLDTGWKAPRCVQACPTGALGFQRIDEESFDQFIESGHYGNVLARSIEKEYRKSREAGTISSSDASFNEVQADVRKDSVLYRNIELYEKTFISGSVATLKNGIEECLHGATVELFRRDTLLNTVETDIFGDFRFDGLPEKSGIYTIRISDGEKRSAQAYVNIDESNSAGVTVMAHVGFPEA